MQRGTGDSRSGDEDGLHERERRHAPGAPDTDADVQELGGDLFGRVLVGDRPTRGPGGGSEAALDCGVVDLHNDAVDLVLDVVAVLAPVGDPLEDLRRIVDAHGMTRHRQAPFTQCQVGVVQAVGTPALRVADAVAVHAEAALGGDRGILLSQ